MGNGVILNYVTTHIDELISKTDRIIADLEGQEGKLLIDESKGLIQTTLHGKYKDALENSLLNVEMSYMDSLANVKALNMVLKKYKEIIDDGTKKQIKRVSDVVSIDFDDLYKQITNLEVKIEDEHILQNILKNDDGFDTWVTNYNTSLDDTFKKTYEVDSEGNMTEAGLLAHWEDQKNEKIFRTNAKLFRKLDVKLAGAFTNTTTLVQSLEVTAGILSKNLEDFSDIWNTFEFTKVDYQNYSTAQFYNIPQDLLDEFQKKIDGISPKIDEILSQFVGLLDNDRYGTGNVQNFEDLSDFLNAYIGLYAWQREVLLSNLSDYIHKREKEILVDYFSGKNAGATWAEYGRLKGFQNLLIDLDNAILDMVIGGLYTGELSITFEDKYFTLTDEKNNIGNSGRCIKIGIPPLTAGELDKVDIYEEYSSTTFAADGALVLVGAAATILSDGASTVVINSISGVSTAIAAISASSDFLSQRGHAQERFVSMFGLSFDKKGNIEFSLYSILMLGELSNQYNEGSDINDDVDKFIGNTSDKKEIDALNNLADWAEAEQGDINRKLGLTNEK